MSGLLLLEDGSRYSGESVGAPGISYGEAVFTTSMTGYQETVTDPSYTGQIICFTAPMVGNYGVGPERCESDRAHASGVLMREARGPQWTRWLAERHIPALSGVDTRSLVLQLRERGAMRAALVTGQAALDEVMAGLSGFPSMAGTALVDRVSTPAPFVHARSGRARVAVLDLGCKRSLLGCLARAGAAVTVFPHRVEAARLARYDGVVLSNGPGDPAPLLHEIETVRALLGQVPVLGICLGHQLLALATGRQTFKLPFGHRGANHPVLARRSGRVLVTSQNHGFAVAADDDPAVSHISLYDGTVEGIELPELEALSYQFHPEAGPGPHDARSSIAAWVDALRPTRRRQALAQAA
ncbi:MAG: glutamine-hydrolyzing carbamoyl-phosphate synthase small subunit [Actinobacteria bacterium]|nr:glutamine-hydrolyzing carbamoyl-phosphate synthase small subunit [Actinomycetota bacterium]